MASWGSKNITSRNTQLNKFPLYLESYAGLNGTTDEAEN